LSSKLLILFIYRASQYCVKIQMRKICLIQKPQQCSVYTTAGSLLQQLAIQSLLLQQLCMRSNLCYNSLVQYTDNVCLLHCCQAVRNSDTGTSLSCLVQSCLHHLFIRNICHTHITQVYLELREHVPCSLNLIMQWLSTVKK